MWAGGAGHAEVQALDTAAFLRIVGFSLPPPVEVNNLAARTVVLP